ncbi:MAG: zinc ribbon domain-containing protein [Polyangiaceae bacterium]|jgi:putative FmdB family regulatory protein
MPLYEYECSAHGLFEAQRTVGEFAARGPCPTCGEASVRVLSVPGLRLVDSASRMARDRNERSQHEPRLVERPSGLRESGAASHGMQTGRAGGLPWAIGHG